MTPVLESINRSMMLTINTMENMARSSDGMFDTAALTEAKETLSKGIVEINNIERETYENVKAQREYNSEVSQSYNLLDGVKGRVLGIVGAYAGLRGLKWFQETSDEMTNIQSRLSMIVDEGRTVAEFQDMIFNSAQRSRGEYKMTLDIVSKLGAQAKNAFSSNEETVMFAENLNKLFVISGTSASGVESVMYNLTQAMASGVLRGQDLNSVIANTPQLLQIVAEYMGTDISMIRKLAEEGELSAQVIKNALLGATEEINEQFGNMPMTFKQFANTAKNVFLKELQPALEAFNNMINSENFKQVVNNVITMITILARFIKELVDVGVAGFDLLYNVIDAIKIPLLAVVGIMGLYKGVLFATAAMEGIKSTASFIHARAISMVAIATGKATAIQGAYNSMLWASPIFIIPALLIGIIAIIFAVVGAINKATGQSISALGIITGAINTAIAFIQNLFIALHNMALQIVQGIANGFLSFAEFLVNVFINPIDAIKGLFSNLAIYVLDILQGLARAIDAIFGSNLSDAVAGWKSDVSTWQNENLGNEYVKLERVNFENSVINRVKYEDAYNKGYEWGAKKQGELEDWISNFQVDGNDYTDSIMDLSNQLGDLNDTTKDIKDEISWENNDLSGLRDLMMQRAVTDLSKEVKIDIYNEYSGNISSDVDIETLKREVSAEMAYALDIALNGGV